MAGLVGEQFALPEAVEALRALRRREPARETLAISAYDPLNPVGALAPGARVPVAPGNLVVLRDGSPASP